MILLYHICAVNIEDDFQLLYLWVLFLAGSPKSYLLFPFCEWRSIRWPKKKKKKYSAKKKKKKKKNRKKTKGQPVIVASSNCHLIWKTNMHCRFHILANKHVSFSKAAFFIPFMFQLVSSCLFLIVFFFDNPFSHCWSGCNSIVVHLFLFFWGGPKPHMPVLQSTNT